MAEEQLSEEDRKILQEAMGYGSPNPEEKHNVHTFLSKVVTTPDTTRVGNLTHEEIGMPKFSTRTLKEIALFSDKVIQNDFFKDYFNQESEILTSTSLSKEAKLINLAVIQKRELADVTKTRKPNKGWFSKKEPEGESS